MLSVYKFSSTYATYVTTFYVCIYPQQVPRDSYFYTTYNMIFVAQTWTSAVLSIQFQNLSMFNSSITFSLLLWGKGKLGRGSWCILLRFLQITYHNPYTGLNANDIPLTKAAFLYVLCFFFLRVLNNRNNNFERYWKGWYTPYDFSASR
jgi:hypothetical protein